MLEITALSKSYKQRQVLTGLNFHVGKGELKALIGINGAGKSTLLDLICGVKKMDSGEIIVDGISLKDKKMRNQIKYTIGYMPQSFCLFNDLTVFENLRYLSAVYKIDVNLDELINKCLLTQYRDALACNLSGGYRQLLSLAGSMIHSPKFLILDEPTSAMDPLFRKSFWKIIKNYNAQGNTILIITHFLEEILECESFACLSHGKISYNDKVNTVKKAGFINIEEVLKKFS